MLQFLTHFWSLSWSLFLDLWYWAIVGTIMALVLKRFMTSERISTVLQRSPFSSIAVATVSGAGLPLCACGVIPFLASFLKIGIPLSAIMAFTAASPLMDPADFMVTAGVLGLNWALVKTGAAIVMGLVIGLLILFQNARGRWLNQVRVRVEDAPLPDKQEGTKENTSFIWRIPIILNNFFQTLWFSGKFLLIAIVLGALIEAAIPHSFIAAVLGGDHWYSIPVASGLGIFSYGISEAPIIKALMHLGMSRGAGMAFLIAGHATSIGLMVTLLTLVKKPIFFFYLSTTLVLSMIVGYGFQLL